MNQKKSAIGELVTFAKEDNSKVYKEIELGVLSNYKAQEVNRATGVIVRDATLILTADGIRHAFNGHGDAKKENERGQIGITDKDFDYVQEIVKNYDSAIRGNKTRAEESIVFIKKIKKQTYHVAISIGYGKKSKKLVFNTMFIKK